MQAATNEVVVGYQEHTARLEKHKADAALERSVLKMFYLDPQKLEVRAHVPSFILPYTRTRLLCIFAACIAGSVHSCSLFSFLLGLAVCTYD